MLDSRISVLAEKGSHKNTPSRSGKQRLEPLVRLRVLQYMSIIYMKKLLAREVAVMSDQRHVTDNQMGRVRELMRDYGKPVVPNTPYALSISVSPSPPPPLSLLSPGPVSGDSSMMPP